jgi:UDP-GlcNAc:undecaprenyl-phosphate GlcNAc-1-phosphate transferase
MVYAAAAAASFIMVFLIVPVVRGIAHKIGFVDRPNLRKIHTEPIPLLGGLAMYVGIIVVLFLFAGFTRLSSCIAIGGFMLVAVGLADDGAKARSKEFPIWPRLIVYIAVSAIPLLFHIRMSAITNPLHGNVIVFPLWFSAAATIIWTFSLINMVNFIDGVDGLASGVAVISSITLFITALVRGHAETAMLAVILIGGCSAFLKFNFYPARIFMGDAGASFLGFTLAVIAVNGAFKSATFVSVAIPLLALAVPILDTVIVMARRLLHGQGLHRADKLHTHHALMRWGLNQIQTVSFIYLIAAVFALLSIVLLLTLD